MKKVLVLVAATVALVFAFSFVACKPSAERSFRVYENAAAYTAGEFTCENTVVKRIEIDWIGGNVEIEQSPSGKVSVFEDENDLAEEKRLHTYLNEGVLRVKYCRSGCLGKIDERQKNLQVDIPKGVSVEINAVSANVYLGVLETEYISVETETGCVEGENIFCKSVEIETRGGYIGMGGLKAERIELDSVSGDIHLGIPVCTDTEIETKSGDVTLYLWEEGCALINFKTQNGVLKTERTYERKGDKYLFAAEKKETLEVCVKTESGNLRVE